MRCRDRDAGCRRGGGPGDGGGWNCGCAGGGCADAKRRGIRGCAERGERRERTLCHGGNGCCRDDRTGDRDGQRLTGMQRVLLAVGERDFNREIRIGQLIDVDLQLLARCQDVALRSAHGDLAARGLKGIVGARAGRMLHREAHFAVENDELGGVDAGRLIESCELDLRRRTDQHARAVGHRDRGLRLFAGNGVGTVGERDRRVGCECLRRSAAALVRYRSVQVRQ